MLKSVRVRDYMLPKPVVVHPDTDLFEAMHLILVNKLSGVTVVDGHHRPVGVLSELDCLRAILSPTYYGEEVGHHPVRDAMTAEVETVGPDDDVIDVARSMIENRRRRRPVVNEDGVMVGQVTCRQLLKVLKDFDRPPDATEEQV